MREKSFSPSMITRVIAAAAAVVALYRAARDNLKGGFVLDEDPLR